MLVLVRKILWILVAGVKAWLLTDSWIRIFGLIFRKLMHRDVAPERMTAIIVDILDAVHELITQRVIAQKPEKCLWYAQVGHNQRRIETSSLRGFDADS